MSAIELVPARFVERPNRFVVRARLEDGAVVEAYLPNTGRLVHLTEPGRPFLLRRDGGPPRRTDYTAVRAWDGCWVALEAGRAPRLLTEWLAAGNPLPGHGPIVSIEHEVPVGQHRLDLRLIARDGTTVWVEVKSGGRATEGVGLLSRTPSSRGVAHLALLERLAEGGEAAAVAFVLQRPDVRALRVGGDADPDWIAAVQSADAAGVEVLAFGCAVTETVVAVDRELAILWEDGRPGIAP